MKKTLAVKEISSLLDEGSKLVGHGRLAGNPFNNLETDEWTISVSFLPFRTYEGFNQLTFLLFATCPVLYSRVQYA